MRPLFMGTASLMLMTYVSFLHVWLTYPGGSLIRRPTHICMHTIHEAAEIHTITKWDKNKRNWKHRWNSQTHFQKTQSHNPFSFLFFRPRKKGTEVQQRSWQTFFTVEGQHLLQTSRQHIILHTESSLLSMPNKYVSGGEGGVWEEMKTQRERKWKKEELLNPVCLKGYSR